MRQQVRQYTYAYAAVAPAIGKMCSLVLPYANTAMMNLFLAQISIEFPEFFIILQVDRAAWPKCQEFKRVVLQKIVKDRKL